MGTEPINTLKYPNTCLVGVANLLMNGLSLLELAIHKLSANRRIGVVAPPLMPNVVFESWLELFRVPSCLSLPWLGFDTISSCCSWLF